MKRLFVGNLPPDATEATVQAMFEVHGTVRSIELAHDIFTGKCKGFAFVGMEGHEARAAQTALDGSINGDSFLKVRFEQPRRGRR